MEAKYWIERWNEDKTAFHLQNYHDKLVEYFPTFNFNEGEKVLVPLCGKSKDLLWLKENKLEVQGVELSEKAILEFFEDANLKNYDVQNEKNYKVFSFENIKISQGDFFKFESEEVYDYVYDRASLVALPKTMRIDYANVISKVIKKGGKYLLVSYEYDQSKMEGPPFSVDENEIHELYQDEFKIELKEAKGPTNEGPRISAQNNVLQKVYILTKI